MKPVGDAKACQRKLKIIAESLKLVIDHKALSVRLKLISEAAAYGKA